jgi:hypothetical protein
MVAATNGPLNDALGDITMDLEPNTLAQLSSAGIKIHTEVIEDAIEELWNTDYAIKLIEFATTTNATIGIDSVPELINFLKDIKCDYVLIAESYVNLGSKTVPLITELLIQNNIKYSHISARKSDSRDIDAIDTKQYKYPVIINTGLWGSNKMKDIHAAKQIFLGNNTPINVI